VEAFGPSGRRILRERSVALDVREQRHLAGPLDRASHLALLLRVQPGRPAGQDLAALGQEPLELADVLVVDQLPGCSGELFFLDIETS